MGSSLKECPFPDPINEGAVVLKRGPSLENYPSAHSAPP